MGVELCRIICRGKRTSTLKGKKYMFIIDFSSYSKEDITLCIPSLCLVMSEMNLMKHVVEISSIEISRYVFDRGKENQRSKAVRIEYTEDNSNEIFMIGMTLELLTRRKNVKEIIAFLKDYQKKGFVIASAMPHSLILVHKEGITSNNIEGVNVI